MEPWLMLRSVKDLLSTLFVHQLIFFALRIFEDGDGLLDTLVEVLQARVKEEMAEIVEEAPRVVALYIFLLGAEERRSFHVDLGITIAEAC
jgi:hypothetical protein